jgi:hypothetical protein
VAENDSVPRSRTSHVYPKQVLLGLEDVTFPKTGKVSLENLCFPRRSIIHHRNQAMEGDDAQGGDFWDAELRERVFSVMQNAVLSQETLVNMLAGLVDSGDEGDHDKVRQQRRRLSRPTSEQYRQSTWWETYLSDPGVEDPTTFIGKQFRTGFRVPFSMFKTLTQIARGLGFSDSEVDNAGQPVAPLELKVRPPLIRLTRAQILGVLRRLGSGVTYWQIWENTKVNKTTMRLFFDEFIDCFVEKLYSSIVYPPTEAQVRFCGLGAVPPRV